jgi:hypothetical protein
MRASVLVLTDLTLMGFCESCDVSCERNSEDVSRSAEVTVAKLTMAVTKTLSTGRELGP